MNGQVLKTLTERTEPLEHLTVSSPGVNWDWHGFVQFTMHGYCMWSHVQ